MGVRGLFGYLENHPELFVNFDLRDIKLIVDGNNIFCDINQPDNRGDAWFGGDYKAIEKRVEKFFKSLLRLKIEPIVVFDGSLDKNSKWSTLIERHNQRIKDGFRQFAKNNQCRVDPIFAIEVFTDVLRNLNIPVYRSAGDADRFIARLANLFNCPVLSSDADFCIFDLHFGYVMYSLNKGVFNVNLNLKDSGDSIKVKLYKISKFEETQKITRSLLPLFATLLGNDFCEQREMEQILQRADIIRRYEKNRIGKVLDYFRNKSFDDVMGTISIYADHQKQEIYLKAISDAVEMYDCSVEKESEKFDICQLITSELKKCNKDLPDWFCTKYANQEMPTWFLCMFTNQKHIIRIELEDFQRTSIYECCEKIRCNIYSILSDKQNLFTEFIRCRKIRQLTEQKIVLLKDAVSLNDVEDCSLSEKRNLFFKYADFNEEDISKINRFPENIVPVVCSIIYWLKNVIKTENDPVFDGLVTGVYVYISMYSMNNIKCPEFFNEIEEERECDMEGLLKYNRVMKSPTEIDIATIHLLNQWQGLALSLNALNAVLNFPFESMKMAEIYSGVLCYNLTKDVFCKKDSFSKAFDRVDVNSRAKGLLVDFRKALVDVAKI